MQKTANEAMQAIEKRATMSAPTLRTLGRMRLGDVIRQGDIYVERVEISRTYDGDKASRQLAVGQTQGSRHVAEGEVTVYAPPKDAGPLVGPMVVARERWTLTHPEHGHFSLPAGTYQVRYQRDYARELAEEIRRVMD